MTSSFGDRTRLNVGRAVDRGRVAGQQLLNRQIEQRSTHLGKQVSATAQAIRDVGSELEKRGQGVSISGLTESVAKYADRIGRYLTSANAQQLGEDFELLAQRQPVLVGGIALLGGFVASRMLRVSTAPGSDGVHASVPGEKS